MLSLNTARDDTVALKWVEALCRSKRLLAIAGPSSAGRCFDQKSRATVRMLTRSKGLLMPLPVDVSRVYTPIRCSWLPLFGGGNSADPRSAWMNCKRTLTPGGGVAD